jgi:WD40 repeat protein
MFSLWRQTGPYRLAACLKGHASGITSLAISPSGYLLGSGGKPDLYLLQTNLQTVTGGDGVRVWDLHTNRQLMPINHDVDSRGAVSYIKWLTRRDEPFDTMCYGTGLGFLVILRQVSQEASAERIDGS